ncbi:peptidoglycan DD-metalloendopeptidase family protein [Ancylobacter sp. 6x-1]|uniref:Peptidoglycan DD-metalloendopeptidase family protein n=1 Tax=Ancylobacter crimeensis TaxID=2579147 RepID=A0ABT0DDN8_9HYPH|nr:peptidoglycan DD-metalloendopeptidase family protein [Ancylobacter crimeensis]MCK0197867.1 peptidoglycan DD-metalloendopeptidase family protein [Ancylobacter crimeensis]
MRPPARFSLLPRRRALPGAALAGALLLAALTGAQAQEADAPRQLDNTADGVRDTSPRSDAAAAASPAGDAAPAAPAQAPAPAADSSGSTPPLDARQDEQRQKMEKLDAALKGSEDEQARLSAEIESVKGDRAKLAGALIDTASRIRDVEEKLDASEQKLTQLGREEGDIRQSLDGRRRELASVLAALIRMRRQPPPALLVRPDDALQSVRSAILLGAMLPELKADTDLLVSELTSLDRVRREAAKERDALAELKGSMAEDQRRISALIAERQKRQEAGEQALENERQNATALAAQAKNVHELMERMESEIAAARRAADAAREAESKAAQSPAAKLAALKDPGRLSPSIAFADARGTLPLPAAGTLLRGFGASDGFGGTQKGMSFSTRPEAQVSAPCDGWVVYAGPFRSYGQLLIINAGGGYHILLAGMDKITVELGQFVLSGEPVAVMGKGPQLASPIGHGTAQPILYVEFRKDGNSIDPSAWWATSDSEKVRG